MTVVLPVFRTLELDGAVAAADRILAHPSCNAVRVSIDETVTFALLTRQYRQLGQLAALSILDPVAGRTALLEHLVASGFLAPAPAEEPTRG